MTLSLVRLEARQNSVSAMLLLTGSETPESNTSWATDEQQAHEKTWLKGIDLQRLRSARSWADYHRTEQNRTEFNGTEEKRREEKEEKEKKEGKRRE